MAALVYPVPVSGAWLVYRVLSGASINAAVVKASTGTVGGWYLFNTAATLRYVKLYNKATTPDPEADTPVMTIPIPSTSGANVEISRGVPFALGIGIAIVAGIADADETAVSANDVVVNLLYV